MEKVEIRQDVIYTPESKKTVIVIGIGGVEKQITVNTVYMNEQVQSGTGYTRDDWNKISNGKDRVVVNDNYIQNKNVDTWNELESFVKSLGFDEEYEHLIIKVAGNIVCESDNINL